MSREELLNWSKEKLVDELVKYMNEDKKRKDKVREWGKSWRDKRKSELEELRELKRQIEEKK